MAFTNLPANLYEYFQSIENRITKLELAPSGPQDTADTAQSTAASASSQSTNALAQSVIAQSQATIASTQATNAQTTANGKNKVYYSTSTPGSTANSVGDIWYQYGVSGTYANKVIAQWSGAGGTSWTPVTVSGLVIANIDAGTITTGVLNAIEINAGSAGTYFHVSPSGYMSAQGIYTSGTVVSSNGVIGGWNLSSTQLYNGATYLESSTGNIYTVGTISTTSTMYANGNITSLGTLGGNALTVATTGNVTGNLTAASYFYNSGHPTTGSAANAYINASTGLLARVSSSIRYKTEIQEQSIPIDSILALKPKSFVDKNEADKQGTTNGLPRILGLIAEEVAEIPVINDLLVNRDEKGRPDSINYDRIAITLIPIIKEMAQKISTLEQEIQTLKQ